MRLRQCLCIAALASLPSAAHAFGTICCNVVISIPNAPWVGYSRDCKGSLKYATAEQLAEACLKMQATPNGVCPDAYSFCEPSDPARVPRKPGAKPPLGIGGSGPGGKVDAKQPTKPEEKDECPGLKPQDALLERALDEWRLRSKDVAAKVKHIQGLTERARTRYESDFNHALRNCQLWETAQVLASLLPKPDVFEAAEKLLNPASELNPVPEDLENALGIVMAGYDITRPRSWEEQVSRLRQCPQVDLVMEGAIAYIRLHQEIEALTREAQVAANNLRSFVEKTLRPSVDKYQRACRARAQCKKLSGDVCDRWPPPAALAGPKR